MIPMLLMLAATDAPAMTPIDAERAFAADAKAIGQWTAFRKWSTDDAVMFVPQPINAHAWLKDHKDPLKAIDWWPTASYISCDGKTAVNTGGWKRPHGSVGYFSTVWQQQKDGGWKWVVDGGGPQKVARARPAEPNFIRASCDKGGIYFDSMLITPGAKIGDGAAADRTLVWHWQVTPDGGRIFSVWLKGETKLIPMVISDVIPPPK